MANDAGTAYIDVRPELKGFGRDLAGGIDPHVDRSAKNVESRFGGAFASVAKVASGLFAAKLGVDAFKDVIGGASDLNETISKSNTIFGSSAAEIEKWAGTASKSVGQSKQGALDAAATFGNLFVQLGSTQGEAAKMSKEMVGLASDFASFHNADISEVISAQTAAFRGEYDAVQRFVPTINAAAVEQEALKLGLAKSTKELTAQDKALATQSLLMKGAGAAVGDFARTSDGLANKQRILSAQFQDVKDKIGTALLPVVLQALQGFLSFGAAIAGPVQSAFATLVPVFATLSATFRTVVDFVRDNAVPALAALGAVVGGVLVAGVVGLGSAILGLLSPFVLIVAGIAAVVAGLIYAYTHFEGFRAVVDGVVGFLTGTVLPAIGGFAGFVAEQFGNLIAFVRQHWGAIQEAISHVVNVVQGIIESFVGVIVAVWRAWGDELMNIVGIVWDQIRNVIETVVGIISGVIAAGLAIINGDWGAAWDAIKGILATAWEFIRETIVNALRLAREAVEGGVSAIVGLVGDVPGRILGALGDLGGLLYNAGRSIISGLLNGIKDAVAGVYDFVSGIAGKIASLKGPIEKDKKLLIPAGEAIMDGLVRGLRAHEGLLVSQLLHTTGLIQSVSPSVGLSTSTSLASGGVSEVPSFPSDVRGLAEALADALTRNPVRAVMDSDHFGRAQANAARSYR